MGRYGSSSTSVDMELDGRREIPVPGPVAQRSEQRTHNPKKGPRRALGAVGKPQKIPANPGKPPLAPDRAVSLESRARRPSVDHREGAVAGGLVPGVASF